MAPRFRLLAVPAVCALLSLTSVATAKDITLPPSGDNQFCSVTQGIGLVRVTVEYSSPDVHGPDGKDRTGPIWGELVPYGLHDLDYNDCKQCPWRGGANENTVFTVSHPVKVEGKDLPAGSYGLFFIAGKEEWTVIFSKNSKSWGAYWYNPAEDQLRVQVKPSECEYREWLTYEFTDRATDHATVALKWERLQVPIRIAVDDMAEVYVANLKQEFRNAQTLSVLAELQLASGKTAEGQKTMAEALTMPDATPVAIHGVARCQQMQGDPELAKRIYLMNAKRFPNQWPVNVGLARYHAMSGDNRQAVAYAKKALTQAPDDGNRKNLETLIQQWSTTAAAASK